MMNLDSGEHPRSTRDARLTEILDAGHTPTAAEIEALLADDPEARQALEEARRARELLSELAAKAPPRDFLRKVQRKLGRRSGGRYFHPAQAVISYRISVEVFSVIAVVIFFACVFMMEAARPKAPGPLVEEPPVPVSHPNMPPKQPAPAEAPATE